MARTSMLVRSDARDWLVPLFVSPHAAERYSVRPLDGGRGGTVMIRTPAGEMVLRPCRRGGLPARLIQETYFGWTPRPFRELCTLEALRLRGVPVVQPIGACVRWLVPGCYRGCLVTRYVPGAQNLWQWASGAVVDGERAAVWRQIGAGVRRLREAGARHPDLNLRNVLLCRQGDSTQVVFVDFDRPPLSGWRGAAADMARLQRSARKLDPGGDHITAADLEDLWLGYRRAVT